MEVLLGLGEIQEVEGSGERRGDSSGSYWDNMTGTGYVPTLVHGRAASTMTCGWKRQPREIRMAAWRTFQQLYEPDQQRSKSAECNRW
jgi:hypothetical protein